MNEDSTRDGPAVRDSRPPSGARRRGRLARGLAAAAVVTVLALAAGVVLIQSDGGSEPPTSPSSTRMFADLLPDATVALPPAPIGTREIPHAIWSGKEWIVWGGLDARRASTGDGAAFNLATGTWRVIAHAPIEGRNHAQVVWTGTEMIVWGGFHRTGAVTDGAYDHRALADGAAYNPTTDTWRRLPEAPIGSGSGCCAVWTGDEMITLGGSEDAPRLAAYNPVTNQWRRLADPPADGSSEEMVWTGTAILATFHLDGSNALARYDASTDTWRVDDGYAALVGLPDADGVARTVLAVPSRPGAPVDILDSAGDSIGRLPGVPADSGEFGNELVASGAWVGQEALLWISGADWFFPSQGSTQAWALSPATETWRSLPGDMVSLDGIVTAGDVLLAWGGEDSEVHGGVAYRVPTASAD